MGGAKPHVDSKKPLARPGASLERTTGLEPATLTLATSLPTEENVLVTGGAGRLRDTISDTKITLRQNRYQGVPPGPTASQSVGLTPEQFIVGVYHRVFLTRARCKDALPGRSPHARPRTAAGTYRQRQPPGCRSVTLDAVASCAPAGQPGLVGCHTRPGIPEEHRSAAAHLTGCLRSRAMHDAR
jgi:hypothetical protein